MYCCVSLFANYSFFFFCSKLQQIGVNTSGVQVEDGGVGFVLRMLQPPQPLVSCSNSVLTAIKLHLLSSSIRTSVNVSHHLLFYLFVYRL